MEYNMLHERIKKNELDIEKVSVATQANYEETCKQKYQIDQLYTKVGNGWSKEVTDDIKELQHRINESECADIRICNKLDNLAAQLEAIKNKPRNTMMRIKDFLYISMAIVSLGTVMLNIMGVI